jgi:hypothetical protein
MPTTTTIPYPLGTTSNGVVIYENSSSMPEFNKNYVLKNSSGTVVSDVFNKGNLDFIDTTIFIDNFNNNANITDSNNANYENTSIPRAVLDDIIASYNTNPDPNLNNLVGGPNDEWGNPITTLDPVTPFGEFVQQLTLSLGTPVFDNTAKLLYTHATINYAINLNSAIEHQKIIGYDYGDPNDPFSQGGGPIYDGYYYTLDTQISYHTLHTLLTIDPNTGEFGYLCTITDLTNINKIVIDNIGSTVYFLVAPTNDYSVVINRLSLSSISNYSATTELYHTRTVAGTEVSISAWNMNVDNNHDLYYLEHFTGNIQKVTGTSTVSTYVNFTYTPAIYGYRERSSTPARGRLDSFVFDSDNNLYVSIDDTSFGPYNNFVNPNDTGNGSKIPYSSTSCLMKIPYTNTPGTVYCPGTTHSAEQSFANNVTVTNPNDSNHPYQVLQSVDMVFDSLGYLIFSSQGYNFNIYRINPSSPDFTTPYFANGGGLAIDNYNNIYTNSSKIAVNYTFTHVYVTSYTNHSATLSLNNTTDSTVVDPNVIVIDALIASDNASITSFTVNGTDIYSSGTTTDNITYNFGTVTLDYTNYVDLEVYRSESHATVTGAGGRGVNVGNNNVTITVTAQDGVTQTFYNVIIKINQDPNVICFKEDSQILCLIDNKEVYVPIQNLRKGTLVKTLASGHLPVELVGHSTIHNSSNKERGIDRLYRCSKSKYPELFEDLIITGCHSILEKDITEEQRQKLIESTGKIYITENRYRLLACLDDRTDTYEVEGNHSIWHFALENENNLSNYGVYANGLLVESCSKRMISEYADMVIIE